MKQNRSPCPEPDIFVCNIRKNGGEAMAKILSACGNDCAACPRYNVPPYEKTDAELIHTAELWKKAGYRDSVVSSQEISCAGCRPSNWCRYKVIACCSEKGIRSCAECREYPCGNIQECFRVTGSFEPQVRAACTAEEYRRMKKAFFEKKENLTAEREKKK
jgi:hypothetical protein